MKRCLFALFAAIGLFSLAAEKLNISFTGPQKCTVAGKEIAINGTFTEDKYMAIGLDGVSFPGAALVGNDKGSIFFGFKIGEMQPPISGVQRVLLALRTGSMLTVGFNYYSKKDLQFVFTEKGTSGIVFAFPERLKEGQDYNVGCTWDGTVVRIYLEGKVIAEREQPKSLKGIVRNLNIGPYKDGWFAPRKWANDTYVKYIRVYDEALTPDEVAKQFNVSFKDLEKTHPQFLSIPKVPDGMEAPANDGKLKEPVWNLAASMPRLVDLNFPEKSGQIPPNIFKLLYDKQNIYIGFSTIFPTGSPLQEGELRTEKKEPTAWANESFEFYLRYKGKTFHFVGNVAGGYMERRNRDQEWNGKWTYTSTKE
ncbi:MAG: hypothetical protein IKS20_13685, partial [Victivallales bacterium]|nr:hypothetical protein [Victivallales bacterium]